MQAVIKGLGAFAAVALILSFAHHAPVHAQAKASACKGLDAAACKKAATCTWVVPKKGKQKPYCRIKTAKKKK